MAFVSISRPSGETIRCPPMCAAVLYRLVQEGLTNVLKHAQASKVSIVLEKKSEGLALVLEDDGIGFDPENVDRVASCGGTGVGIGPLRHEGAGCASRRHDRHRIRAGKGSTIFVQIPLEASETVQ